MSHRKRGFKVIGLSFVAALAFMAVGVVVAQAAEDEGDFMAGGTALTASESFLGTGLDLKLLVISIGLNVLCLKAHAEGTALGGTKATNGVAHGKIIFKECNAFDNKGNPNTTCVLHDIEAAGLAQVVLVKGFTGEKFVLFKPETGKPFTTIHTLNAPKKICTLELEYTVSNTLLTKASFNATHNSSCTEGGAGKELFLKEATPSQSAAGGDDLLVGTHSATIDGCVFAHYTGVLEPELVGILNL
jgi:hypothetical protein